MPPSGPSEVPGDGGPYGDPEAAGNYNQTIWLGWRVLAAPVCVIPPIIHAVQRPSRHAGRVDRGLSHAVLLWLFGADFPLQSV